MKKLCLFHSNCADGFGAAWVVRRALGDNVEFFPATHGKPLPVDVTDRDVIMVDFCYPLDIMEHVLGIAASLTVIDHHATAEPVLKHLDLMSAGHSAFGYTFDLNRSGAGLTWDVYFGPAPRPRLINHIEDRDLWRFKIHNSEAIAANLFSFPYDFAVWDAMIDGFDLPGDAGSDFRRSFIAEGLAIQRKHRKDVAELITAAARQMAIGGTRVLTLNVPYTMASEAGDQMLAREPLMPYCATYYDAPHGRVFSLRARDGGADVGMVAKGYGGGGHKSAAGFRAPIGWEGDDKGPAFQTGERIVTERSVPMGPGPRPLRVLEGRWYKTRSGHVVGPMTRHGDDTLTAPLGDEARAALGLQGPNTLGRWAYDGSQGDPMIPKLLPGPSRFDLVAEVPAPPRASNRGTALAEFDKPAGGR